MARISAGFSLMVFFTVAGLHANACENEQIEHSHDGEPAQDQAVDAARMELEIIRDRVLRRCGLTSRLARNKLPWYFHYEYGIELIRAGAAGYAVEPLQLTANLRSEPARNARMYGMWFVDYLPYYQISLAYSELGEWDNAWDAIRLSEAQEEIAAGDAEYDRFASLKRLVAENRRPAD